MKRRYKTQGLAFNIVNYTVYALIALCCLYPFYYIFIVSLSSPEEVSRGHVFLIPMGFTLSNFARVFALRDIPQAFFISLSRTVIGTAITVFCTSLFAYILTRKELRIRKIVYRFTVTSMYFNAGLIPWYILMLKLGLKNNFLLYVIPSAVIAFYLILIKTYLEQIPPSLEESAMVDGAGFFTIYMRIIIPVSMPIIATIAVFSAVDQWNTWYDNLFLVNKQSLKTLQLMLYEVIRDAELYANQQVSDLASHNGGGAVGVVHRLTPTTIRMTVTMIVTIPILFVYPFMQKYFVKGIMIGAIKG